MSFPIPKSLAVLGAGKSGLAAARLGRKLGAKVVVLDGGDPERLSAAGQTLEEEGFRFLFGPEADQFGELVELVVQSPGIDLSRPIVTQFTSRDIPVVGEIEFAWRFCESEVVAITGTNGKTTTTEMVARVLEHAGKHSVSAGNYGVAFF